MAERNKRTRKSKLIPRSDEYETTGFQVDGNVKRKKSSPDSTPKMQFMIDVEVEECDEDENKITEIKSEEIEVDCENIANVALCGQNVRTEIEKKPQTEIPKTKNTTQVDRKIISIRKQKPVSLYTILSNNTIDRNQIDASNHEISFLYTISNDEIINLSKNIQRLSSNLADKYLHISVMNDIGKFLCNRTMLSEFDVQFLNVLIKWRNWLSQDSTSKSHPICYICYICGKAWWHFAEFRDHVIIHTKDVIIDLQISMHACLIVAYTDKIQFHNEVFGNGKCWKCNKEFVQHPFEHYKCIGCANTYNNCLILREHEGICDSYRKRMGFTEQIDCSVCNVIFFSNDDINQHMITSHTVRSDVPTCVNYNNKCTHCGENYVYNSMHYCLQRTLSVMCLFCNRQFPSNALLTMHYKTNANSVKCKICKMTMRGCILHLHMTLHTDNYSLVYRCNQCPSLVFTCKEIAIKTHQSIKHNNHFNYEMIPVPNSCLNSGNSLPIRVTTKESNMATRSLLISNRSKQKSSNASVNEYCKSDKLKKKKERKFINSTHDVTSSVKTRVTKIDSTNIADKMDVNDDKIIHMKQELIEIHEEFPCVEETSVIRENALLEKESDVDDDRSMIFEPSMTSLNSAKLSRDMNSIVKNTSKQQQYCRDNDSKNILNYEVPIVSRTDTAKIKKVDEANIEDDIIDTKKNSTVNLIESIKCNINDTLYAPKSRTTNDSDNLTNLNNNEIKKEIIESNEYSYEIVISKIKHKTIDTDTDRPETEIEVRSVKKYSDDKLLEPEVSAQIDNDPEIAQRKCRYNLKHYKSLKPSDCSRVPRKIINSSKRAIKCSQCNTSWTSLTRYIKHLDKHNLERFTCPQCLMRFKRMAQLVSHITNHASSLFTRVSVIAETDEMDKDKISMKRHQCKKCHVFRNNRSEFLEHWESHLELYDVKKKLLCQNNKTNAVELKKQQSAKVLDSGLLTTLLDTLQTNRSDDKPWRVCCVCQRRFSRVSDGKRHIIEHLLVNAWDNFDKNKGLKCQLCVNKVFLKPDKYKLHMREHASLHVYRCELCDHAFSDSSNFTKHKKVHNLMVCICDLCKRKFQSKVSLEKHMEMHTVTKPITCDCGKIFYFQSQYNKHYRQFHEKNPSYKCSICRLVFPSLKVKWNHMWGEHRQRNVNADCPICDAQFRRSSDVKRHIAAVHVDKFVVKEEAVDSEQVAVNSENEVVDSEQEEIVDSELADIEIKNNEDGVEEAVFVLYE